MKGIVFVERISDSVMDALHGGFYAVTRVLIPEEDNLIFCVHRDREPAVFVYGPSDEHLLEALDSKEYTQREIEVPDALVAHAKKFLAEKKQLQAAMNDSVRQFWSSASLPTTEVR